MPKAVAVGPKHLLMVAALLAAFAAGFWCGEWELNYLVRMPMPDGVTQGTGIYLGRYNRIWSKTGQNRFALTLIPSPSQARLVHMFPRQEKKDKQEKKEETTP